MYIINIIYNKYWFPLRCVTHLNCVRVCTYSTRIVRESSRVRVGACRGPGGSWEVSMVTCELLEQPFEVHALSARTWVEYTPSPETNTQAVEEQESMHTRTTAAQHKRNLELHYEAKPFAASRTLKSLCVYWNSPLCSVLLAHFLFLSFRFYLCLKSALHLSHSCILILGNMIYPCIYCIIAASIILPITVNIRHCAISPAWMIWALMHSLTYQDMRIVLGSGKFCNVSARE